MKTPHISKASLGLMIKCLCEDFGIEKVIPIIKAIRAVTGWGLKEAKEAYDEYKPDSFK